MKVLFSKMFVGTFNNENIGHEVINFYLPDDADDKAYLYIPPYGKQAKEADFIVLLGPSVKKAYPIWGIVKNPTPLSKDRSEELAKKVKYYGKAVEDISFKKYKEKYINEEDINNDEQVNDEEIDIQNLTFQYDINNIFEPKPEEKYYAVPKEDDLDFIKGKLGVNCYMLPKNPQRALAVMAEYEKDSKDEFFKLLTNIEKVFINRKLKTVKQTENEKENPIEINEDSFISFIDKKYEETVYSNMICKVLNLGGDEYKLSFVKFLLNRDSFSPTLKFTVDKEMVALTEMQKEIKKVKSLRLKPESKEKAREKFLKKYPNIDINSCKDGVFSKNTGRIDLLIKNEKYMIVIENKIKSSINGTYLDEDGNKQTQITKYKEYIDQLKKEGYTGETYTLIFAPNYNLQFETETSVISYKDLYNFFYNNRPQNARKEYYDEFLAALAFHTLSKEEEINRRFLLTIKK